MHISQRYFIIDNFYIDHRGRIFVITLKVRFSSGRLQIHIRDLLLARLQNDLGEVMHVTHAGPQTVVVSANGQAIFHN